MNPDIIPKTGLKAYVAKLAQTHNLSCSTTKTDRLARVITRLSGDDVIPDETEKLIIELRKAKVIDGKTMTTILGNYLDELRKV